MKYISLIIILLIFLSSCDFEIDTEQLMKAVKIYKTAELKATFPKCPEDRPYRIGMPLSGPCVNSEEFEYFLGLRLQGSTSDSEKNFILTIKAQQIGNKKNCPADKPYYVSKFIFFGGECLSKTDFEKRKDVEIDEWTKKETEQGKHRFIESAEYCENGFLYDTQEHLCVSTEQCDTAGSYFNIDTGDCSCNEGYRLTNEGCEIEPTNKQCKYDSDCGKPSCSGSTKVTPRCNAREYKCYTDRVDCKEDFGMGATCSSGLCVG